MLDEQETTAAAATAAVVVETSATFIIISVILSTIVAATIIGNLFVILAILLDKNLQTTANQLVLSLAVADLMVACLVMPLGAYNDIHNGWYLSKEVCEFWTSADVLCCTASILNLLAIAIDRYWAVTNVDYIYRRTRRRVNVMILCAWTVGAVVSLAPIFGWKDPDFAKRVIEEHKCMVSQDVSYQIFATISTFYAPLVLLLGLYWRIFQVARKRIRRKPGQTRGPAAAAVVAVRGAKANTTTDQPFVSRSDATKETKQILHNSQLGSNCNKGQQDSLMTNCSSIRVEPEDDELDAQFSRETFVSEQGAKDSKSNYNGRSPFSNLMVAQKATSKANCDKTDSVVHMEQASCQVDKHDISQQPAELDTSSKIYKDGRSIMCEALKGLEKRQQAVVVADSAGCGPSSTGDAHGCVGGSGSGGCCRCCCCCKDTMQKQDKEIEQSRLPSCSKSDNKNNGPKQTLSAMHDAGSSGGGDAEKFTSAVEKHDQRKEGWRRNKVAPIGELYPSSSLVVPLRPMRVEQEDSPASAKTKPPRGTGRGKTHRRSGRGHDNNNNNIETNDNDKWKRNLDAETQAFGSLSSSSSSSSTSSVSSNSFSESASNSRLFCWQGRRSQFDGGGATTTTTRGSSGLCIEGRQQTAMLLSSSSSGVKMDEGDLGQAAKQLNCCCLSLRRQCQCQCGRHSADGRCSKGTSANQLSVERQNEGELEVSRGCDCSEAAAPSSRHCYGSGGCGSLQHYKPRKRPSTESEASGARQINHGPPAEAPTSQDKVAYLATSCCCSSGTADSTQESSKFSTRQVAEACLKLPEGLSAVLTTQARLQRQEATAPAAATNGLNKELDKQEEKSSVEGPCLYCRGRLSQGSKPRTNLCQEPTDQPVNINQLAASTTHLEVHKLADGDDNLSAAAAATAAAAAAADHRSEADRNNNQDDDDQQQDEVKSSISASSSLVACLHQADVGQFILDYNGQDDDDDDDGDGDGDDQRSSSLSTSFPPRLRDLLGPDHGSSPSSMSASLHSTHNNGVDNNEATNADAADDQAKSHNRTSGRINNLIGDLAAKSIAAINTKADTDEVGGNDNRPTVAANNLSTSSALLLLSSSSSPPPRNPLRSKQSSLLTRLKQTETDSVAAKSIEGKKVAKVGVGMNVDHQQQQQQPEPKLPNSDETNKVQRNLERQDPIQVRSLKWSVGAHSNKSADSRPVSVQRQERSSLQLRRRFKAMGQLVSFVQTSHHLNASSSISSNSASSLRSNLAPADNNHPAKGSKQAAATLNILQQPQRPGEKAAAAAAAAAVSAVSLTKLSIDNHQSDQEQCDQLAIISGKMIDGTSTVCQEQRHKFSTGIDRVAVLPLGSPSVAISGGTTATNPPLTPSIQLQFDDGGAIGKHSPNNRHPNHHQQPHHHHRPKQMVMAAPTGGKGPGAGGGGGGGGGRTRSANMDIKREKKAAKTLAIITGVFVCCWLPFFLNAIIMPICGPACTPSDLVLSILLWLGYLNSLLNPIIYTIFSPDFRRAFRRLLCWPQLINLGCSGTDGNPNTANLSSSW